MKKLLVFLITGLCAAIVSYLVGNHLHWGGLIVYLSYPNLMLAFFIFLAGLYSLHRNEWNLANLLPGNRWEYLVIFGVSVLLLTQEPFQFRIVFDELLLAVGAELMHFTRMVGLPQEANDHNGSYEFFSVVAQKRPYFYPFILSLVHDVTGYRYSNGFYLNGFLTILLLILVNFMGRLFGGNKGGMLCVLLAGTLPLLGSMTSSGNLEILNLLMLSIAIIMAFLYIKGPCNERLVPLVYCLILFFQIRYENGIYLIPFGLLILMGWQKAAKPILPWQVVISPIFLILPTIHYFIISKNTKYYFQEGPNGRKDTFSLAYFPENVEGAGRFLFSLGKSHPNSILLTITGICSLVLFLYYFFSLSRRRRESSPHATILLIFFLGVSLHLMLLFLFNYGTFDRYITSRLSLPLHMLFILLAAFVAARFKLKLKWTLLATALFSLYFIFLSLPKESIASSGLQFAAGWTIFLALVLYTFKRYKPPLALSILASVYILVVAIPIGRSHAYTFSSLINETINSELKFLETQKDKRVLVITLAPYAAFLTRTNTVPLKLVNQNPSAVKEILDGNGYDSVFVIRRFVRKEGEKEFQLFFDEAHLDENKFKLKRIMVCRARTDLFLQIDEVVSINNDHGN